MTQEVLYRKWRPRRFVDVAGQDPVITTLRNAVSLATPAHAYLLCGPRGTGKTTTGRILAKAVNCTAPDDGEPCEACPSCVSYNEGRAIDLIELDAASNRGIDEIRDLREGAGYAPAGGQYKVYLIDEVHMLTDQAFNALLKTLEEPPPHVIFILATTEPHRIPATILSRCQRFDLRRIPLDAVIARLQVIGDGEGFEVEPGGYELIAKQATGSLRDAVNLLDQLVAYHGPHLTLDEVRSGLGLIVDDRAADLARAAISRDLSAGLSILSRARDDGLEVRAFVREVVEVLRTVLLLKAGAEDQLGLSDGQAEELNQLASDAGVGDIVAALQALTGINFAGDAYDALPVEIAFATLATGVGAPVAAAEPVRAASAPAQAQRGAAREAPAGGREAPAARRRDGGGGTAPASSAPASTPPREAARSAPAESAPAPAATFSPPDAGDVSDELTALRARWDEVRAAAKRVHPRAGALLTSPSQAYPRAVKDGVVELGFQFPAHVDLAERMRGELTQAVTSVLEQPLTLTPVLWPELATAGSGASRSTPATSSGASSGPSALVQEAMKQGAEPIEDGDASEGSS